MRLAQHSLQIKIAQYNTVNSSDSWRHIAETIEMDKMKCTSAKKDWLALPIKHQDIVINM